MAIIPVQKSTLSVRIPDTQHLCIMPDILIIPGNLNTNTVEVELSKEGLVIDSRVIRLDFIGRKFECSIKGTLLKVTRIDQNQGWRNSLHFRIYDPAVESIPEFNSKSYRYHGLEDEMAPCDVEEAIVDPSVKIIIKSAFENCKKMKRCIMGGSVERIEDGAFFNCKAMKSIRLPRSLRYIGVAAFSSCESIECLFIPPNVEEIQHQAFMSCKRMKILVFPTSIDFERLGDRIAYGCHKLLIGTVQYAVGCRPPNYHQVNHWLSHQYDHLPLLRLSTDPDVTATMIRNFVQDNGTGPFYETDGVYGLTPLHILTRYNAYANKDAIMACHSANPGALFTPDTDSDTPLDYLWADGKVDIIFHLVQDLCIHLLYN